MRGRFRVGPGDVILHSAFDAHLDRFGSQTTEILNLPVSRGSRPTTWTGRVSDADAIVQVAERDLSAAGTLLLEQLVAAFLGQNDWPDQLAEALQHDPNRKLEELAGHLGFAPETLSRGFRKAYGVTPAGFRSEARARRALDLLEAGDGALASVAGALGFADQPHMSRAVRKLTGVAPGRWKRQIRSRQAPRDLARIEDGNT